MFHFIKKIFRRPQEDENSIVQSFKSKYEAFRNLLESNSELLRITSELQELLEGDKVFGMSDLRMHSARSVFHAASIVKSLNEISAGAYPGLQRKVEELGREIEICLGSDFAVQEYPFVMWHTAIGRDLAAVVGGKNANLGEIVSQVGLPVPRGFAITVSAFLTLMETDGLLEKIRSVAINVLPDDTLSLVQCSREIERLITQGKFPEELELAIYEAWDRRFSPGQRVALRSSAVGEDSELSFAGQYLSLMGVGRDEVLAGYRQVVASLFSPAAMAYRLFQGVLLEQSLMSVVCMEMVDTVASGVVYSRHPFQPNNLQIVVQAIWGHGSYLVDGRVTPDSFWVERGETLQIVSREGKKQSVQSVLVNGRLQEEVLAKDKQNKPCLNDEQVLTLANWVLRLEEHYNCPQDMEWVLDRSGKLLVVQTRPLAFGDLEEKEVEGSVGEQNDLPLAGRELLLEAGKTVCPGGGSGAVFFVENEEDMNAFPVDGVLVVRHSSPRYTPVLQRASAVVADFGGLSGHMASLVREFHVPALFDAGDATEKLQAGEIVTVDATHQRIYKGRVPELLSGGGHKKGKMIGSLVYEKLEKLAELIVPLHLIEPKAETFLAKNCQSLHDVMRFAHERSYAEMFFLNDLTSSNSSISVRLVAKVPFDLYLIDLGNGLKVPVRSKQTVSKSDILSAPFLALLHGMEEQNHNTSEPRPVHLEGFFSVLSEQMLAPPRLETERFGDRSYALVSDRYLNFSSRVGYHYGIVDAYCGNTLSNNYVNFQFKGGAADELRRSRRAVAISRILQKYGFEVEVILDRVVARFSKYEKKNILLMLEIIGRLLIFTRQMDMLMNSEKSIDDAVSSFLQGKHELSCPKTGERV